ncbi:MAG: hypothetical protein U0414_42450 [Polyangiaceae bacterium]
MGFVAWPAYDPANESVLVFEDGADADTQGSSMKCDFWDGIAAE